MNSYKMRASLMIVPACITISYPTEVGIKRNNSGFGPIILAFTVITTTIVGISASKFIKKRNAEIREKNGEEITDTTITPSKRWENIRNKTDKN